MTAKAEPPTWSELRASFALDPDVTFLDSMLMASQPAPVHEATLGHLAALNAHPQAYFDLMERKKGTSNAIARCAAEYLGLSDPDTSGPRDIALTDSTTMGLGLLYDGLLLGRCQRVLISACTPFFTVSALTLRRDSEFDVDALDEADDSPADDMGTALEWSRLDHVSLWDDLDALDVEAIVARALAAIRPETRVLGLTWVSSATGLKLPVRAICEAVRALNEREGRSPKRRVLTVVDGVHGFGIEDVGFDDLSCDFFVTGCHKWLFGPLGTGIVCGRPDAWPWVVPTIPAFRPGAEPGRVHSPGGINSYANQWALREAFELHLALGKHRVAARTHELATALKQGLAGIPGVRMVTPMSVEFSSGIVCCDVTRAKPRAVVERLLAEFAISATVSLTDHRDDSHHVRFSPSVRNTDEEIERAVDAMRTIARSA